jgi:cytochrome c oxidase accessory protein FixG
MSHPEYQHTSSIRSDGSRPKIRIAEVVGRFTTRKNWVFTLLILIFFTLPWIRVGAERLVLLWIQKREFTFFTLTFNAQDVYLIFFLVTGIGFSLFFITALYGRIWCGWTCPQTVFLEGMFRKIERWVEGSRSEQLKLEKSSWGAKKIGKFLFKHSIFILLSFFISATFVLYFVPGNYYSEMFHQGLLTHPVLLFWIVFMAGLMYFDFAWFREQVCLILCPYGRLQSALTDDDSLVIGYDKLRGEPRTKGKVNGAGDCIDCGRCVAVCPTGIDIRAGLQLECVGCANCIDACDEIMTKVARPVGLIRYDSLNGLEKKPRKILRPRIYLYIVLMLIGATVASFTIRQRSSFEANVIRLAGSPYFLEMENVRNQFEIHLVNKTAKDSKYLISVSPIEHVQVILPVPEVDLSARSDRHIPWMAVITQKNFSDDFDINLQIKNAQSGEMVERKVRFLGPKQKGE